MVSSALNVGVVGGSVGGAAVAAVLSQQGHHVTVFERSSNLMQDLGAGIVVPFPLIDQLKQRGLFDVEMHVAQRALLQACRASPRIAADLGRPA